MVGIRNGQWDPDYGDVTRFTEGDCHVFARAVSRMTGWPCVTFDYPNDPRGSIHCGVQMPDGRVIDVLGVHDPEEFANKWADFGYPTFSQRSSRLMRQWGRPNYGNYSYRRARQLAKSLLAYYNIHPEGTP